MDQRGLTLCILSIVPVPFDHVPPPMRKHSFSHSAMVQFSQD